MFKIQNITRVNRIRIIKKRLSKDQLIRIEKDKVKQVNNKFKKQRNKRSSHIDELI